MKPFDTRRWTGIVAITLLLLGIGVIVERPGLVLGGVIGIAYAAGSRVGEAPAPDLRIERKLSNATPEPESTVEVTLEIENTGQTLSDIRIVDGVPPALEVTEGSPRHASALTAGASTTVSYSVRSIRGTHEWSPIRIITRNLSGSRERESRHETETTLICIPELTTGAALPLRGLTTQYTGRIGTDLGGTGVEFHSERQYRSGDPARRIDWNRLARTGQLATKEFRQERAATVVLLVDARKEAYRAADEGGENAVERSVDAAGHAATALLESGDQVGLAALSPTDCWLPPGAGRDHRQRIRNLLAENPAFGSTPPDETLYPRSAFRVLRRRLPADAQVLLFSPACDDTITRLARRFDAYGHLVTLVSPDPTTDETAGMVLAAIERQNRLSQLRRSGIRVVDWGEDSLASAVADARQGWLR